MKRIYTKNNYLIIEWTGSAPLMRPKKDISFRRTNANHNQFIIADRSQPIPGELQTVLWTDFVKENGENFGSLVEFNDWITNNTGNFKSGSDNGEFEPNNYDLAEFNNQSEDPFLKSSQKPKDGEKGEKGDRGEPGIQGIQGLPGKDGLNGSNGVDGARGEQGPKGDTGNTGPIGPSGPQGERGNDGSVGPRGLKGEEGATGLQGPKGDKGDKGDTGAQGPIGLTGPKGDQGIQGVKGDTGAQGPRGDKGDTGVAGVNSFSIPILRTPINKATAYQASVTTKPAIITITLSSTSSFTLTGNVSNEANIVIGATNAVATGTGQVMGKYANVLGGGLVVGVSVTNKSTQTYTINLPAGYFFAILNANNTSGVTIDSVFDQTVG